VKHIEPGTLLGKVRLREIIGEGSSGVVFSARHVHLGTDVAVKVMYPRSGHGADDRARFLREARLAARLKDPAIVQVSDYGEHGDACYVVMELVTGATLEAFLERQRGPVQELTVIKILQRVARALRVAHTAGLVHRDLKPANILIERTGQLKVTDFGLAAGSGSPSTGADGLFNGTPAYMAPECATRGARVDGRADLYALGVIGYELAFGCMPYSGQLNELIEAHQQGQANFDRPTKCSPRMLKILRRMIAPNPDMRVQSAEELLQLLEATPASPPTGSPGAFIQASTASDDFSSLSRFIEDRFSGSFTEHAQGRVVHSSGRERVLVWGLLVAVVATLVAGFVLR